MAYIRQELSARGSQLNVTDVVEVHAELAGFETDFGEQLATVVFSGKVREEQGGAPVEFEEVWLLTRPMQGGGWVLSGIHNLS